MPPDCGVLLVGHGSRNRAATIAVQTIASLLGDALAPCRVEPAFLELVEPTIGDSLAKLIQAGVQKIVVAPLLLFAAGHARQDIPGAVEAARRRLLSPSVSIRRAPHLGLHPAIVELSRLRFTEALQGQPTALAAETCLLMVGRGSSDIRAAEEMEQLARLRLAQGEVAQCSVAYVAVGRPALTEALSQIAVQRWRRVIIQPHLLFPGEVHDSLVEVAASMQQPSQEWHIAPLLAAEPKPRDLATDLLLRAIGDRIREAT